MSRIAAWDDPDDDDVDPPAVAPRPLVPIPPSQPIVPPDNRRSPITNAPIPEDNRDDVLAFLSSYLQQNAPDRGPFQLKKGENQQIPGVSLPIPLVNVLNIISGRPETPYNHDRATLVRDLLYLGAAAWIHVLTQYNDDPNLRYAANIVRHQEQLRQQIYVEELLMNYVEDLAVIAGLLELKLQARRRQAVYQQLAMLLHHAEQITDRAFWRPTILRMIFNVPEVRDALDFLVEEPSYRLRADVDAWVNIMHRSMQDPEADIDLPTLPHEDPPEYEP